jgi:hypothetical protein
MSVGLAQKNKFGFQVFIQTALQTLPGGFKFFPHIPAVFTQRSPQREARSVKRSEKDKTKILTKER